MLAPLAAWDRRARRAILGELAERGKAELVAAGHGARAVRHHFALDLRYAGQSFELRVPESADPAAAFHQAHERLYGYRLPERELELVCLRARSSVPAPELAPGRARRRALPAAARSGTLAVRFGDAPVQALLVERAALAAGHSFAGPALVQEYSGTTLVPPGWGARVSPGGHLLLERSGE